MSIRCAPQHATTTLLDGSLVGPPAAGLRAASQASRRWLGALVLGIFSGFAGLSCGGGEYGFARTYSPLGAEGTHYEQAQQPSYQDLIREPNKYKEIEIGWFGVVTGVASAGKGKSRITLSLRAHQARHLCSEESSSSCRVTVSEGSVATFSADVELTGSETAGKERVWTGSLLKVYGKFTGEYSEETGPVIDVTYHRHWPRGTFVTTASRASMRR